MSWGVSDRLDSTLLELDCGHLPLLELPDGFDHALLTAVKDAQGS